MMMWNSGSNFRVLGGAVVLVWGVGAIPGAAADQVCYTTLDGFWQCTQRLPLGDRIAIIIGGCILISILMSLGICFCMRRRRVQEKQRQDAIAAVYQIEPSQIQGPPTTYVTSFDTRSPAGYPLPPSAYIPNITRTNSPGPPTSFPETPAGYAHTPGADSPSDPRAHNFSGRSAGAASAKRVHFPPTETHYQGKFSTNKTPQTAPANPAFSGLGAYPFPGYSPKPEPTQPYTAYSIRYPRQLYTGQPVQKDGNSDVKVRDLV
ncbi:hypothetical protein E4T56_gene20272 [Termitomyces sp. T112]|nr:hypothetical protein E4T56_gene20272 [Termitomyces sp. T112]